MTEMSDQSYDRFLSAIESHTKSTAETGANLATLSANVVALNQTINVQTSTFSAKIENLDRSVEELKLDVESSSKSVAQVNESLRKELDRIHSLLNEERKDRQSIANAGVAQAVGSKDEMRQMLEDLMAEERKSRQDRRQSWSKVGTAIWKAGGSWLVGGGVLLILSLLSKITGTSFIEILGIMK